MLSVASYASVRQRSLMLAEPLSDEDCGAQSMAEASPTKWHLAHTTWFFETFVLERYEPAFTPFHPAFRMLFNSYYNGVGERHPRARRGLLTRPTMVEVRAWRLDVDTRVQRLLTTHGGNAELARLLVLGLHHEQQHQELMLTDVKHLLAQSVLFSAYLPAPPLPACAVQALALPLDWIAIEGGLVDIGHQGASFSFDNELPRHRQYVAPFALGARLVTNGEYLAFLEAGGYRDPSLWLAEGWDRVCELALTQPLYWQRDAHGQWHEFTLHGLEKIDLARPVCHVSLYEAAACAHWMGARLPTEAEWEVAGAGVGVGVGVGVIAAGAGLHPAAAPSVGLTQMFGDCWQWTSSSYAPYPGYACASGALGEYNGKFMLNQYVLRGSSCVTPPAHARSSYRNFFPAGTRWQFSGIRLAK